MWFGVFFICGNLGFRIFCFSGLEKSKIQNNVIFNLTVSLMRCPITYLLQFSDPFDISTGKNIWAHYVENHFWASKLLRLVYPLAISQPHAGTRSRCPEGLLPALSPPWFFPRHNPSTWVAGGIAARPLEQAKGTCSCGVQCMHLGNCSDADPGGLNETFWVWPWRALKVRGPCLFSCLMFTSQMIPVCPNLPPPNFKSHCSTRWTQQEVTQGNASGNGL